MLGNTYHLMLRPGAEVVARFGGLGRFAGWDGLTLTDSGGFQVFSLEPQVDDDGVTFRSTYDGSMHRFTPGGGGARRRSCSAPTSRWCSTCARRCRARPTSCGWRSSAPPAWAVRARAAHRRDDQALFGIVQGGIDATLRGRERRRTTELDFDGYGIGGLSVGETRAEMLPALAAALDHLPADRPRYLMGVGDPAALVEAVALGVDQFDCVMQTRLGRHGTALTGGRQGPRQGSPQRRRATSRSTSTCPCEVCARHSRGYLRHLFQVGEPTAARLVSLHNVAWTLDLMARMRAAIEHGTFGRLRLGCVPSGLCVR